MYERYKFYIGNNLVDGSCARYNDNLVKGELFNVYYLKSDSRESTIDFTQYYITQEFDSTYSVYLQDKNWAKGVTGHVYFKYVVEGDTIERVHNFQASSNVNLESTDSVKVYYSINNPSISYIGLNGRPPEIEIDLYKRLSKALDEN